MGRLFEKLTQDVRFIEGLKACLNCGTCTAICPAAEFYDYQPRKIVDILQTHEDDKIEALLKSETIWYCGECMSCVTRCPRGNAPGLLITALRSLSQEMGFFIESEKGRQQLAIKRTIGEWILNYGYCLYPSLIQPEMHPEQGPVWEWEHQNLSEIMDRLGANYQKTGPGILRKIPREDLDEIKRIFDETGATERFAKIEEFSKKKAHEMNMDFDESMDNEYFKHIYNKTEKDHIREK
ncbi:MAG: 4Fe-4S dicluster domain-containing protein [Bacteroidales bacterium]|nr:4Fe-4S dicluster domain-containing protein [Bacteroidales bacterium]HNW73795.1 4Fe-4S dicluster domain-containing protein [Bacteroidales bacterium]HPS50519.1 4Fe-4S dicluster domain-containing protein [Bacteroidales bacterium]